MTPGIHAAQKAVAQNLRNAALSELRHNLRTPVNHVLGYAEMLIEDASEARNAAALEALRQIHSTGRGALADINAVLSNRDAVEFTEIQSLYERIQPRVERIEHYVDHLRTDVEPPVDWASDLERIEHAARSLLAWLGDGHRPELPTEPPPAPQSRPAAARLLLVDNNAATRTLLRRRLERQGYTVLEAATGHEVVDRLAVERFDAVLLDVRMADSGGFAMLEHRRRDRRMQQTPVLMVCMPDEAERVARAIELGAEDYLCRPFDPVLLRTRIDAVLERRRLGEQSKIASLGVLTSDIVHEVRNPLNFVLNFAALAEGLAREQAMLLGGTSPEAVMEVRRMAAEIGIHLAKIQEHGARIEEVLASMLANSGAPAETAAAEPE